MDTYLLEMRHITKRYGENTVLKDMELLVKPHEIHALLGENGAGKSTLMNILFGMPVIQDSGGFEGEIRLEGKPVQIDTPIKAMEAGIGMVHQEFMMIPGFTIAENIKLNREPLKKSLAGKLGGKFLSVIDFDQMGRDARAALDQVGMDVDEQALIDRLPVGHMQFVEISREIDKKNVKLLVFDEPTAVLTESEAQVLLGIMRKLADSGISIIFITHRLDEVMEVADQVTVFRDGELVGSMPIEETDTEKIAEMMIGRKMGEPFEKAKAGGEEKAPFAMELRNFAVDMPGERTKNVSLQIKKGEIFGLAGLAGQGKISIANGIMGIYPSRGELFVNGELISKITPQKILERGCAFVSEDRKGTGLLLDNSIEDNIAVAAMKVQKKYLRRFGFFTQMDKGGIRSHAQEMIKALDIRCTGPSQYTRRLSGGNQQKVCVARALSLEPDILMVSEPTRGIDIGAKRLLMEYLVRLNQERGMTIIITSSELAELRAVCDRIAIIFDGSVAGILPPDASDREYGLYMMGYDAGKKKGAWQNMSEKIINGLKRFGSARLIISLFFIALLVVTYVMDLSFGATVSDVLVRWCMNFVLVLAMVPSVLSGCGLNFASTLGISCGLLGGVLSIEFGFTGLSSLIMAGIFGCVFAAVIGALYGKLLNYIKGSEMMIATYVGFAFVSLMCIVWVFLPITNDTLRLAMGGGVRLNVELSATFGHLLNDFLPVKAGGITIPLGFMLVCAVFSLLLALFLNSRTGRMMRVAGENPKFAQALDISVNKNRILGTMLSTMISAVGILFYAQSYGFLQLYTAPLKMSFLAVAAVLIGGATTRKASIGNVVLGTLLFNGILATSTPVANALAPDSNLAEIVRIIVSNGIIVYALTKIKREV